jgi:GDP-L-fucose synthase
VKVLIAGETGLAGGAISREYKRLGYEVEGISRKTVDLLDQNKTLKFLMDCRPELVVDAAAMVGGIGANNAYPVDFLLNNLRIQNNLMESSFVAGVRKFVFLGSSCIYPKKAVQPIVENALMTGQLEETNSAYAIAKIAGIEMIRSFRKQYGLPWISLMPTNLYGPNDNFDLQSSHVLPALIRKFIEAKESSNPRVVLWGSGAPLREFLHVEDLARAVVLASESYDDDLHLNVGTGQDISIFELATKISSLVGYQGEVLWDDSMPDGTPRKILDVGRIKSLGWEPRISLEKGISSTIAWYQDADRRGAVRK